ncbi:MAG: twin-arginine translocase TatA/TatE family subunit [Bacteroidia bacterium]
MLLFFDVSGGEIVVILMFVLIFFGSKKIPEMARGLGKGIREIKDASDAIKREIQQEGNKMKDDLVDTGKSMLEAAEEEETPADKQIEEKPTQELEEKKPAAPDEEPKSGPIARDQDFS